MSHPSRSLRLTYVALFSLGLAALVVLAAAPAESDAARSCYGKRAKIVGTPGNDVLRGTRGNNSIVGLGGNDRIIGKGGNDRICGGGGNDTVLGTAGNDRLSGGGGRDRVSGGTGNDKADGGAGADRVFGDNGNDRAEGGGGNDLVDGGLGDETGGPRGVFGGGGSDTVIGGTGVDDVDGGAGNGDVVRGDQGPDKIDGGPGRRDIASFTTVSVVSELGSASPGCRNTAGFALVVELNRGVACSFLEPRKILAEPVRGIEDVAGSSYPDRIEGDGGNNRIDGGPGDDILSGGGGSDTAFGGSGYDRCSSFKVEDSCPGPRASSRQLSVELSRSIDGSSTLVVIGRDDADEISIGRYGDGYTVSTNGPLVGTGCKTGRTSAECPVNRLTTILGDAGGGGDKFTIGNDVPGYVRTTVIGGGGSDTITGGPGSDHLDGGADGRDTLRGRGGGDALYGGGSDPDRLIAGAGTDLNTLPATCGAGNYINGGPGRDNASYALTPHNSVWVMSLKSNSAGFRQRGCGTDKFVGVSSLEGTKGKDILIGDGGKNAMLGHDGADVFNAGGGRDYVDARSDDRDRTINCGGGRDTLLRDGIDPRGTSC